MNDEQLCLLMDRVSADHAAKGQTYGTGVPYRKHLEDVERILRTACSATWSEEGAACDLIAAGILHDWFEDCFDGSLKFSHVSLTWRLIAWQSDFGVSAVSLMIALRCTDPHGNGRFTRKEAKEIVLPFIVACEGARAVKLADRIANLQQSIRDRSRKHLCRYLDEGVHFAPVADQGTTPDDAVLETRQYGAVRNFLAGQYQDILSQAAETLRQLEEAKS